MGEGKERMLLDWVSVRNAILRANNGEMKVSYLKQPHSEDKKAVVGIFVEVQLNFDKPLPQDFTKDEMAAIEEYLKEIDAEEKEKKE